MSISRILMNQDIYGNPYEFQPERWLGSPAQKAHLAKYFVPFGRGTRMCAGSKYAIFSKFQLLTVSILQTNQGTIVSLGLSS